MCSILFLCCLFKTVFSKSLNFFWMWLFKSRLLWDRYTALSFYNSFLGDLLFLNNYYLRGRFGGSWLRFCARIVRLTTLLLCNLDSLNNGLIMQFLRFRFKFGLKLNYGIQRSCPTLWLCGICSMESRIDSFDEDWFKVR